MFQHIMHPRRCGKTQSIAEIKKLNEFIFNNTEDIPLAPKEWHQKTGEEVLQDLMSFLKRPEMKEDKLKPYWSAERLSDKKEVERLTNERSGLQKYYNYPYPTGEIYFLGYINTDNGRGDRWYLRDLGRIIETTLKPECGSLMFEGKFSL